MKMREALDVIMEQEEVNKTELAALLGLTPGMISHYYKHNHYPRLGIAANIYKKYMIQVEPFTELALSDEIERQHDS